MIFECPRCRYGKIRLSEFRRTSEMSAIDVCLRHQVPRCSSSTAKWPWSPVGAKTGLPGLRLTSADVVTTPLLLNRKVTALRAM
jgi:hypothetical protein